MHGGLNTAWFVQREVLHRFVDDDSAAVNTNYVMIGIHADALTGHDIPVDLDASLVDELF